MGIDDRKNREKEERRASILAKAKELVLEHGVALLTMQEIANAAELSKATLYLYFDSKEAILIDIMDEASSMFLAYVRENIVKPASGLEALRMLWACYLDYFRESRDIIVLTGIRRFIDPGFPLFSASPAAGIKAAPLESSQQMIQLISDLLRQGIEDGSIINTMSPDTLAKIIIGISTSIIDTIAQLPRAMRDETMIATQMHRTFELLLRGLAASIHAESQPAITPLRRTSHGKIL